MTPTTVELLKAWFIFSFSLGCWTCLNLLLSRRGERNVKLIVLGFILLLMTQPMSAYLNLIGVYPVEWILTLSRKLTWTYGPLMVILIQYVLLKRLPPSSFAHAIPFALITIHDVFHLQWLSFNLITALLFVQVFSYLFYAFYLLKTNRERILKLTSQFKSTSYYWLMYLVGGLFSLIVFDVAVYTGVLLNYVQSFLYVGLAVIACLFSIYIDVIAIFSIYQPDVFTHDISEVEAPETKSKPHIRSIELTPEAAQQLDEQLNTLVVTHKPHLDENISLPKLASLLGVTSHQLSELLNIHKSISFYDFLNNLRHQESLRFLTTSESELTIADIAYRSGYNNLNSFYKVFKEKTGKTPSQYKKSHG